MVFRVFVVAFLTFTWINFALGSADLWNRYECVYGKQSGVWRSSYTMFSTDSFAVKSGSFNNGVHSWTTVPDANGLYYGVCGQLRSSPQPDKVLIVNFAWSAKSIDEITDCQLIGSGAKLISAVKRELARGESVSISLPWSDKFDELTVVTYIPKVEELADPATASDEACTPLAPR